MMADPAQILEPTVAADPDRLAGELRQALRGVAATVAVVSATYAGERYAMAATSFTPLSMAPPSILICVNRASSLYRPLTHGIGFCVNLLSPRHERLARVCGGGDRDERFAAGDFIDDDRDGAPYLGDAQCSIQCSQDGRYLYGTHAVVIGKVKSIRSSGHIDPLIYLDGQYSAVCAP